MNECIYNKRDGSVIYGNNQEVLNKVRTFEDGKLKISKDGNLLQNEDGTAISGDVRNSWAGVSTLQALFIQEHNAVCDALKVYIIYFFFNGKLLVISILQNIMLVFSLSDENCSPFMLLVALKISKMLLLLPTK
jgi:hypothetical protein